MPSSRVIVLLVAVVVHVTAWKHDQPTKGGLNDANSANANKNTAASATTKNKEMPLAGGKPEAAQEAKAAETRVAGKGFQVARAKEGVLGMLEVPPGSEPATGPSALAPLPDTVPTTVALFLAAEKPEMLDRRVGTHEVWWKTCFLISVVLVFAGIALGLGLGKKIDKQEASAEFFGGKGFVQGALVTVTTTFMSNGEPPVELKKNQSGVIQKIDAVGDALIRFADHGKSQWVYESNYDNLRVR